MFRFGDGTPFPLRENFIETLVAAIDCCVAIYQVQARVEEHQARQREARRVAAEELNRLDALHALIETAVAPLVIGNEERAAGASAQAAARIFDTASSIIRNSRASVARQRDNASQEPLPPAALEAVPVALGQFFCRHQLPHTEWHARWQASSDGAVTADLGAHATRELELVFRGHPATGSFWSRPMPMAELFGAPVTATVEGGKGRRRQLRLDPTILVEVQIGPTGQGMVLRESAKRGAAGYHILMPRSGEVSPLVVALDRNDQSRGQPFYLDPLSAAAVVAVWGGLEREIPALIASRQELVAVRLGGRHVSEIEHPAQLAEAILMPLAPIVREVRVRSRVPGELILKRDLAGDRREEMFVPRQVLWNKLAVLSPRHRQLFEAIGLSNDAAPEFAARTSQNAVRSRADGQRAVGSEAPPPAEWSGLPAIEGYGFARDPGSVDSVQAQRTPPPSPALQDHPASDSSTDDTTTAAGVGQQADLTAARGPGEDPEVRRLIDRATG